LLAAQALNFLAVAIYLNLVALYLLLLAVICILLPLQLIPDQCPGAESKAAADGRARSRMPYRRAD
jgi:hypothetical protein